MLHAIQGYINRKIVPDKPAEENGSDPHIENIGENREPADSPETTDPGKQPANRPSVERKSGPEKKGSGASVPAVNKSAIQNALDKLPQTGTMEWMAAPLAGTGCLCIGAGLFLRKRKGRDHETKRGF